MDDAQLLAERFLSRAESTANRNKNAGFNRLVSAVANDIIQGKFGIDQGLKGILDIHPQMDAGGGRKLLKLWCDLLPKSDDLLLRE